MLREDIFDRSTQKRVFSTTYVVRNGVELFDAADKAEPQGIVAKRVDSLYRRGRSHDWIKIKTAHGRAIDKEGARWNER